MQRWKTLSRSVVLERGSFLTVEDHTVELPDGRTIEQWPWLITPDFVNVVAVTEAGEFLCFRQIKYAANGVSLAPVGGYLEPDEDPLKAGQRELLEETGYTAPDWTDLGHYPVDGNRGAGQAHLYLARRARRAGNPTEGDLEEQELLHLSRAEVEAALARGEFQILPWTTAMALALLYTQE
jgi:ADP-ribose pyrophosphatase